MWHQLLYAAVKSFSRLKKADLTLVESSGNYNMTNQTKVNKNLPNKPNLPSRIHEAKPKNSEWYDKIFKLLRCSLYTYICLKWLGFTRYISIFVHLCGPYWQYFTRCLFQCSLCTKISFFPRYDIKNCRLVATQRGVTLCKFFSEFLTQAPPLATIGENIYNYSTCFVHEIVRLRRYS